jgi:hypothetical protein
LVRMPLKSDNRFKSNTIDLVRDEGDKG